MGGPFIHNSHMSTRRSFIRTLSLSSLTFSALHPAKALRFDDQIWHNVASWGMEGKGWNDTERDYDRLPAKAQSIVRTPVWDLSRHSAGICTHFITDAPSLSVRYLLRSDRLALPHMPATGVSGLDLYRRDEYGKWRWTAVKMPTGQWVEGTIAEELPLLPQMHRLYLPLYNGIEKLELGIPANAQFEPIPPRDLKPILFYGTSILHGACASRPGMAFPAILGRRLQVPTINLGFSGNGRMEAEVASLLAEVEAAIYVIDCLPNMNAEMVRERAPKFIDIIRERRPDIPILLVEDRMNDNASFREGRVTHHLENRKALRHVFENAQARGITQLYYLNGENHLGQDGEATTDGSHPNDLGMMRYADSYEPALRQILSQF